MLHYSLYKNNIIIKKNNIFYSKNPNNLHKYVKGVKPMVKEGLSINPFLRKFLHRLSITGTFMFVFGILYLLQRYTIGLLFSFNDLKIYDFPIHVAVFTITTLIIMKKFIKISSPYE